MTRILLVDDHPLLRQGIAMTIEAEADFQVVAQAGDADEALALFAEAAPDLVITDISLPGANGLELMKNLLTLRPDLPVLVVSRHDEDLYAERAIRAGARGYVSKLAAGDQIVSAIRRVLRGGIHLSEALKDRMLFGAAAGVKDATQTPLEVLSDRELEVFEMTGRGIPTREISERLHLSVKTVESYRSRLKAKLGIANGTELIKHAVAWVQGEGSGRQPTT
jgi:DNA-binding NarL/FixJ family response regulator